MHCKRSPRSPAPSRDEEEEEEEEEEEDVRVSISICVELQIVSSNAIANYSLTTRNAFGQFADADEVQLRKRMLQSRWHENCSE